MVPQVQAQEPIEPQELIDQRTRTSKTYWLGEDRYALDVSIGSIHYKDNQDNPSEQWKDIDSNIKFSTKPDWDWEVVKGNWHLLIKDDTSVALGKDGNWIGFRYDGLAYLDIDTKDYVILDNRRDVSPTVFRNKIRWEGIFYGVNLEYIYTNDRFKENLEITQAARDWLSVNPPSSYGLNNQSTYLVGYIAVDWRNAYSAELDTGESINWNQSLETETGSILFRHPVKDYIVSALPLDYARHDDVEEENWVPIRKRFIGKNGNHYLLFGASVSKLNQLPYGTITLDPTVDEQVGASADDAFQATDDSVDITTISHIVDNVAEHLGVRYQNITIGQGETIDSAFFILFITASGHDEPYHNLRGELSVDAAQFTTDSNNIDARGRTTANVQWNVANLGADVGEEWEWGSASGDPTNGADIKAIIQEIIDQGGWVSGNALVLIYEQISTISTRDLGAHMWDQAGNVMGCKLHIEYTAGNGVSAPTVTTDNATSVEETTATLSGNITATGGENADYRGFEWDTDTGAPYSSNWTDSGNFTVGNFTHGLTSLTEGELYYYRAMAHNSEGWGYGSEVTFLTKPVEPGSFVAAAGEERVDLTWANGAGADNTTVRAKIGSYPTDYNDGTLIYNGTGSSANHSPLTPGDHWYYGGYSWCSEGGLEQWSDAAAQDDAIPYTTPTVTTANATDITYNSATLSGNITSTGYINATERGFDWGTGTGNYTDDWTEVGSFPVGVFTHRPSDFSGNTTYYVRAKTTNPAGWAYGSEISFTTLETPGLPPEAPTNFTLVDLGGVIISANWTSSVNATQSLILVSRADFPSSPNATLYEVAYSGNASSANLTGFALENTEYSLSVWGWNANGYSDNYATASIGTEVDWLSFITEGDMETLAETLEGFLAPIGLFNISLLSVAIFGLAFWRRSMVLFVLAGISTLIFGLYFTDTHLAIGVLIAILGLYCFWKAAETKL